MQGLTAISSSNMHSVIFIDDAETSLHHSVSGPIPKISQSTECVSIILTLFHYSCPWTDSSSQYEACLRMVVPGPEVPREIEHFLRMRLRRKPVIRSYPVAMVDEKLFHESFLA